MTPWPATPDKIAEQLSLFIHPDQFTELRALHVGHRGRTFSGWFDGNHLRDLARQALALSRQAAAVYFVPNPVDPAIAAKRRNQVLDVHRGFALTHDADVIERRFLIIDIDPHRSRFNSDGVLDPSQDCPTSARELAFAHRVATRFVRPFLADLGFKFPLVMMSGNGVHLVYQTAPTPARECGHGDPFAGLLRELSVRFDCWSLSIDTNTFNPCRMLKVPGTIVRKGESSPDRPHRLARILEVPDGWRQPQRPDTGNDAGADNERTSERTSERAIASDAERGSARRAENPRSTPARVGPARRSTRKAQPADRLFDAGSGTDRAPLH